jgi:hypothetical protein
MILNLNFFFKLLIEVCLLFFVKAADDCKENSFDIVINENDIQVNYETIKIDFQIKLKQGISNINESLYASKCLKEIIFEYKIAKELGVQSRVITYKQLKSFEVFDDLRYLSEYEFEIKYVQTNGFKYDAQKLKNINTCFGSPGELTDFNWEEKDNKVHVTWKEPKKINAPKVCSYHILVLNHDKNKLNITVQSGKEFIFDGSRINTEIFVNAYNEDTCYKANYPWIDKCIHKQAYGPFSRTPLKEESTTSVSTMTTLTSHSHTTTNTTNKNNSNILVSNIYIIYFTLAFIVLLF